MLYNNIPDIIGTNAFPDTALSINKKVMAIRLLWHTKNNNFLGVLFCKNTI